jgi:hypothetical protein
MMNTPPDSFKVHWRLNVKQMLLPGAVQPSGFAGIQV